MSRRSARSSSIAGVFLATAWCGCSHEAVVDLTIHVDPSVPDSVVAQVRSVELDVSGLFTNMRNAPLTQPFAPGGSERVVIRSPIDGDVTLAVAGLDDTRTPLVAGTTTFTLRTGATSAQSVTLQLASRSGPVVCPSDVLLCDGFEGGSVSTTSWDDGATQTNGSVTVDQTHVHRGQYALHVHTNAVASGSAEASIGETHTFTPPGASFWVRAFYYFPSNASTATATLLDATQKTTPFDDVALAIDHDALSIYNGFNGGSYVASSTPLLPLDTWVCLEWQVYTGAPNQLHAWVDGQPVAALDSMQPTTAAQPIGRFSVGMGIYPPNTSPMALDAWIDDVIFDHAPIGCAR